MAKRNSRGCGDCNSNGRPGLAKYAGTGLAIAYAAFTTGCATPSIEQRSTELGIPDGDGIIRFSQDHNYGTWQEEGYHLNTNGVATVEFFREGRVCPVAHSTKDKADIWVDGLKKNDKYELKGEVWYPVGVESGLERVAATSITVPRNTNAVSPIAQVPYNGGKATERETPYGTVTQVGVDGNGNLEFKTGVSVKFDGARDLGVNLLEGSMRFLDGFAIKPFSMYARDVDANGNIVKDRKLTWGEKFWGKDSIWAPMVVGKNHNWTSGKRTMEAGESSRWIALIYAAARAFGGESSNDSPADPIIPDPVDPRRPDPTPDPVYDWGQGGPVGN